MTVLPPTPETGPEHLRVPWAHSDRAVPRRVIRPLQAFLETELASVVLLGAALGAALLWANGPWSESYERLWGTTAGVTVGRWDVTEDLRGWVNEGLMTLFFLVVSLEIKRELLTGELRDRRAATLPVAAAIGGMLVPAVLFLLVTAGTAASEGWGIAMPTDIALALAVVAFATPWASPGLRLMLLALAIVDDLGAIVVVALVYSGAVSMTALALAGGCALAIVGLRAAGVRATAPFVGVGIAMWLALHGSGVSPTMAGVAMGFLTPAVALHRPDTVSRVAHRVADDTVDDPSPPDADASQWLELARLSRAAVSPLARVEAGLHPWTSYVVVPAFALANAGIRLGGGWLHAPLSRRIVIALVVARVVGKPLGIAAACAAAVAMKLARLPAGLSWRHVAAVGAAAGIPFTVSIFISEVSYADPALVVAAKVAVAISALVAAAAGFILLRRAERRGAGR